MDFVSMDANMESDAVHAAPFNHVVIVGMGLIGASIAEAVREVWPEVAIDGVDTDERTRETALARGIADRTAPDAGDEFASMLNDGCDLVILAIPVDFAEPYLEAIAQCGYEGIVTDTASTKARISAMAGQALTHPEHFVPGHPMSGSEKSGIEGARGDLFQGAYWILCPDADTPSEHIPLLHDFVTGLGARAIVIPRNDHDRVVAVVSHVPHLVASSLVTLADKASDEQRLVMRLAAGGFKDTTRIAAGSPDLWCGIAFDNAEAVKQGLHDMQDILGAFARALEDGDRDAMKGLLSQAAQVRRALPAAWVPSSEKLLEVRIPITNHPGAVAHATAIASEAGCNIQSIEIGHVTENRAYLSMVLTDEGDIGRLSVHLIEAGYAVSFSPLASQADSHE